MNLHQQLADIYDYFNEELFEKILGEKIDNTLITLQRKNGVVGYMLAERFASNDGDKPKLSEIALNIEYFGFHPRIHLLQNIVHQMMHCYQHQYGEVSKLGSHDEQFQDFMNAIGLQTSDTGAPFGKPIGGKKVFNYPLPDGAFIEVCEEIAKNGMLPEWFEMEMPKGYCLKSIMEGMYRIKELLPEDINPLLLEVPFFKLSGIDTEALIECIDVDEKSEVTIDKEKAVVLAEKAIDTKRAAAETPKQAPTHASEPKAVVEERTPRFSSTFADDSDSNNEDDQPVPTIRMPGRDDYAGQVPLETRDPQPSHQYENTEDFSDKGVQDFEDEDDEAAKFIKSKESQQEKQTGKKTVVPDAPVVVQSIDQMAAVLGLASADAPKPPEKKKTKFKYTCSCGNEIWGGLSLSVICGKCSLHFMCETIEKETDVVFND